MTQTNGTNVTPEKLQNNLTNVKTIHFLKAANSYVLNQDFQPGQVATLPIKIANYFLLNKIAEEIKNKPVSIEPAKRPPKYIDHPLIRKNAIEARLYQEISFAETVKKNALIILPTGLGKTIIAILNSVYWLSKDESNQVIMFAPTRPLLDQHYETFQNNLMLSDDEIIQITGRTCKGKRERLFEDARMIFMTPQVRLNDFNLEHVTLMIFDECHRAVKNYSYVSNAKKYFNEAKNPHVLGLTATPGTPNTLINVMNNLHIEKVNLFNEESPEVKPYIHNIYEEYIKITLPPEVMELRNFIDKCLKQKLKILQSNPLVQKYIENKYQINPHELIRIVKMHMNIMFSVKPILMQVLSLAYLLNLVEAQSLKALEHKLITLENSRNPIYQQIRLILNNLKRKKIEHPKSKMAADIIQNFCTTHKDSRILVFIQFIDSLEIVLEELENRGLQASKLVGQKNMPQELQKETLDKFKDGEFQILVATSVAEEGLDVAQCDLVVFYDCLPSGIRTIQRRGRTGRRREGRLIYFYTEGTWEESYIYISRKRIKETNAILKLMERQHDPLQFLKDYLKTKGN